jgi:uncharacterized metal-binding protein
MKSLRKGRKMVDLPKKKIGIVACSGEELPEGTVTRLAALKVLERLRPAETVSICLPLFLAGGQGDRAFAKFYPTVAIDGCELRCAARATEMYSSKPAASIMVRDLINEHGLDGPQGKRRLNSAGLQAVELTAGRIVETVDQLLDKSWDRRAGTFAGTRESGRAPKESVEAENEKVATCSCGSGIPIQKIVIAGQEVILVGLPLIFQQFHEAGRAPGEATLRQLVETVKIYNPIPVEAETAYVTAIARAYAVFWEREEPARQDKSG